jgi:hypothetical protein
MFGEMLEEEVFAAAEAQPQCRRILLCRHLVHRATCRSPAGMGKSAGAVVVEVNPHPTPLSDAADYSIRSGASQFFAALCTKLTWRTRLETESIAGLSDAAINGARPIGYNAALSLPRPEPACADQPIQQSSRESHSLSFPLPRSPLAKGGEKLQFPSFAGSADALLIAHAASEAVLTPRAHARRAHRQRWAMPTVCCRKSPGSLPNCAYACCRTGKRCPMTVFRRTTTSFPSDWQRSMLSCAASATCCWSPPALRFTVWRRRPIWPPTPSSSSRARSSMPGQFRAQVTLAGYAHVTQVVAPGEYSIRGGLVDLFPMGSPCPTASISFDNEIESIKTFDVDNQRTLYPVPEVRLLPAREFPLDDQGRTRFRQRFREMFEGDPGRSGIYKDVSNGIPAAGIEYWLPLFFEETATLFDYLPSATRALPARQRAGSDSYLLARGAVTLHDAVGRAQPAATATGRSLSGRRTFLHRRQGLCPSEPDGRQ